MGARKAEAPIPNRGQMHPFGQLIKFKPDKDTKNNRVFRIFAFKRSQGWSEDGHGGEGRRDLVAFRVAEVSSDLRASALRPRRQGLVEKRRAFAVPRAGFEPHG